MTKKYQIHIKQIGKADLSIPEIAIIRADNQKTAIQIAREAFAPRRAYFRTIKETPNWQN